MWYNIYINLDKPSCAFLGKVTDGKTKMNINKEKIIEIAILVGIGFLTVEVASLMLGQKTQAPVVKPVAPAVQTKQRLAVNSPAINNRQQNSQLTLTGGTAPAQVVPEISEPKVFGEITKDDIRKGQVKWKTPQELGDLGWTSKEVYQGIYQDQDYGTFSGGVKYVKVGTITGGKYKGADVIVVAYHFYLGGPQGSNPGISHYLQLGKKVVYLPNAGTADGEQGVDESMLIQWAANTGSDTGALAIKAPNGSIDLSTRIEDLSSYANEIHGANDRQKFVREQYASQAFFSDDGLKPIFNHPELGQIWMMDATTKRVSREELNNYFGFDTDTNGQSVRKKLNYDPVVVGGFYLRRPDGLFATYRLKLDIFDTSDIQGVLLATWKNGERNTSTYEEYPHGCGVVNYAYDVTGKIDIQKDLVKIGKTDQGDDLYGYKEANPDLKKYYEDTYLPMYTDPNVPMYSDTRSTTEKDTPEVWNEFVRNHAVVFWVDPFGRLLEFFSTANMALAECGKPVVYLYPEKTTDVSVKVFPNEGVSVSDPAYGDGWNVTAQPDGTLTNHADGLQYPNLFWEGGSSVIYKTPTRGFVTAREDLKTFFDGKLSELGLSAKEAADFEEYWISKMNEKPKPFYFVTFLSREQIDQLAPLSITPKPDTVIRVMMDYEGLDAWKEVPGFSIRTPQRKGFTAVEWGGRLKQQ